MAANTGTAEEINLREVAGVGQGIPRSVADDLRSQVEQTPSTAFYQQKGAAAYPFEALESNTISKVVKPVIDAWFKVCAYSYVSLSQILIY
jgi:hypothetical protein